MRKTAIALVWLGLLGTDRARAQGAVCDCYIGSIASFDFNIGLPDPAGDAVEVVRQQALMAAPRYFSVRVFEGSDCSNYRRLDAAMLVASSGDGTLRSGRSSNVAPAGAVKAVEYLFSGDVTGSGGSYTVTVRLETGYSRQTIRSGSVALTLDSSGPLASLPQKMTEQTGNAMRELARQFQPLGSLILNFERNEREQKTSVARTTQGGKLELRPERSKMNVDETIRVDVTMTDCDGVPLRDREVRFTEGEWPDLPPIPGTTKGTVSPNPVTTDGDGKATVYFTAKEKGTAMVRAWYGHYRPSGHPNALFTEVPVSVSQPPRYQVTVSINHGRWEDQEDIRYTNQGGLIAEQILHNTEAWKWGFIFDAPAVPGILKEGDLRLNEGPNRFEYSRFERRTQYELNELLTGYIERQEATPRKNPCPKAEGAADAPVESACLHWMFNSYLSGIQIPDIPIPLPPGAPAPEVPKMITIVIPVFADLDRRFSTFSRSSGWKDENASFPFPASMPTGVVLKAGEKGVTWDEKDGRTTVTYKFSKITTRPEVNYKLEELDEVVVEIVTM